MALSTHRAIQLSDLADRASTNRVRYYNAAIKAKDLGNFGAASHFTQRAQKWESIRRLATIRLLAPAIGRSLA
jgi:hypothetical protein